MTGDYILAIKAAAARRRIPSSVNRPCSECGEDVVISPTSLAKMDEGWLPICATCAVDVGLVDQGELMPVSDAQLAELDEALRLDP